MEVGVGGGVGVSVGAGVGVGVGNAVGVGVGIPTVMVTGIVVTVIFNAGMLPGNGAVANADRVRSSASSPLTATTSRAKMKTAKRNILDALLVPSYFNVLPASFLQRCNDFSSNRYLLLPSVNNFHTARFHYGRQARVSEG